MGFIAALKHAWNAFSKPNRTYASSLPVRMSSFYQPSISIRGEASILSSVYNKMALQVASTKIEHIRLDDDGRFKETIKSTLNDRLTKDANKDQLGCQLIHEFILTMFMDGVAAIVPVDCDIDPQNGSFEIYSMRVGRITEWYEDEVEVECFNEKTQQRETLMVLKAKTVILQNPFYHVMNEPNSTFQRLIQKTGLLDYIDKESGSGKLDLIIQLPYSTKQESRKLQAEERVKSIEDQLMNRRYGIAYIDAAERVTQLNRPAENNLMSQVQYLTEELYSQLGIPISVFNGTASEAEMLNYKTTTIDPIVNQLCLELEIKFLTKTARTQKQTIGCFRDAFSMVPAEQLADIADKFTRNAILSSNEVRSIIGFKPSSDPDADRLRNKNLNESKNPNVSMNPEKGEEQENG